MLGWNKDLWLIDPGSCLYFQYNWDLWKEKAVGPFAYIKDHVLLSAATELAAADKYCRSLLTPAAIDDLVGQIPVDWLQWSDRTEEPEELRQVYSEFLKLRLGHSAEFIEEADNARNALI